MRICHVLTSLRKASGVTTFVENVVREQRLLGHAVDICTNQEVDKFLCSPSPSTFTYSIIHIHGLWSPLLHKAARFACRHNIPIVWSTHGMTAPWSLHHKWWKKCLPWYLYQLPDLRSAALIHCTTDLESDWNRALGLTNTFVAPLGTTLPPGRGACPYAPAGEVENGRGRSPSDPHVLLYVGRVYPVKALDNAIRAIALMKNPIILRIVGPDQAGHKAELISLCESLGIPYTDSMAERSRAGGCEADGRRHTSSAKTSACAEGTCVIFVGPKYDAELSAEYDACDALILVSHTENFGATVTDALAHSKPVITSTHTPWKIVADKGCGWWVDNSPESLARAFAQMLGCTDAQLRDMGANGLALVKQSYTWPAIAKNICMEYEGVLSAAP